MKNLAIIPARSGSKGLIDKNIKSLMNKPLLAYTIDAAKKSGIFDEIMVSTDSEKYAEIALSYGAKVPFYRSSELSNDIASSWDVVKDVIYKYQEQGCNFNTICLLQPTSPLRTFEDILDGYKVMSEKNANMVVSVCEMDHSPLWSNTLPESHSMEKFIREEVKNTPRQLLPKYFRINGALYIVSVEYLLKSEDLYSDGCFASIMSKENSIDIDDHMDFMIAQFLMEKKEDLK